MARFSAALRGLVLPASVSITFSRGGATRGSGCGRGGLATRWITLASRADARDSERTERCDRADPTELRAELAEPVRSGSDASASLAAAMVWRRSSEAVGA